MNNINKVKVQKIITDECLMKVHLGDRIVFVWKNEESGQLRLEM